MTVIFMSASISPQLIKLFPEALSSIGGDVSPSDRQFYLLRLVTRDFCDRLTVEQRTKLRAAVNQSSIEADLKSILIGSFFA